MTKKFELTFSLELETDEIKGLSDEAHYHLAIKQLQQQLEQGIAHCTSYKVQTITPTTIPLEHMQAGLIVEHKKYGTGFVVHVTQEPVYKVTIYFGRGVIHQFGTNETIHYTDTPFDEVRKYDYPNYNLQGGSGYLKVNNGLLPVIIVPTDLEDKVTFVLACHYLDRKAQPTFFKCQKSALESYFFSNENV